MESKIPKYCIGEIKPYQKGENIFELFRKVAERVPNQIAVIAEDTEYTYAQVFEMAENAAAYFHSKGVQAGDRFNRLSNCVYHCCNLRINQIGSSIYPA